MISKLTFLLFILYSCVFLMSSQVIRPALVDNMMAMDKMDRVEMMKDVQKIQTINAQKMAAHQNIQEINQLISNEQSVVPDSKIKLDFYTLANTIFSSQKYFGNFCDRCKKLEYMSFRMGNRYLTANLTHLKFQVNPSGSPFNNQLFIAEQQIDGSWAFKSLTQGRYIRADFDGSTINYQSAVGPWERWYMERHGNHVHVQSATFEHFYWISSFNVLKQLNGGASGFIVEHWPKLQWLWNW